MGYMTQDIAEIGLNTRRACQNFNTYGESEKMVSASRFESSDPTPPRLKIEAQDSKLITHDTILNKAGLVSSVQWISLPASTGGT